MTLQQWYEKGMDPDDYIESMQKNKENLLHIYDSYTVPTDSKFFNEVREKKLRAIVITEDWCGDAMLNLPILFHIAQEANIELRILPRDNNLQLMDQYLTNGKSRSIPIFIFMNEKSEEVAKWGPRAPKIQSFVEDAMAGLPSKNADDFQEKQSELFTFLTKSFRNNIDFRNDVYDSLKKTLQSI